MTTPMHISANQWRVTILKACVGTQVARGVAEDIADASIALLALGQNPLMPVLETLGQYESTTTSPAWPNGSDTVQLGSLQVLHHGPSIIDMAQAGLICCCDIDSHPLLLGLAQARLHSHGIQFEYCDDGSNWRPVITILSNGQALPDGGPVWLRTSSSGEIVPAQLTNLPQPTRENWARLQTYADQIMVPADDTNRADAGAGLTDND